MIYPILHEMEAEGIIISKEEGRKKVYSITKKGKERMKRMKEMIKTKIEFHNIMLKYLFK